MSNVPDPLLGLPFDLHERYTITRRVADAVWPDRSAPLRILDVGGHSSPLKYLLPEDRVVLMDVKDPGSLTHLPIRYDAYVQGSGASLPFQDNSFDLVAAHDTLEHIPSDAREAFLAELIRVARGVVVINGPVYEPATARAEWIMARLQQRLGLGENVFLSEHLRFGLPERRAIGEQLDGFGVSWISIPNGHLGVWLGAGVLKELALSIYPDGELTDLVDRSLNATDRLRRVPGRSYREAYVVAVQPGSAEALERVRDAVPSLPLVEMPGFERTLSELEAFVREAPTMPRGSRVRELEAQLAELQDAYERATSGSGRRLIDGIESRLSKVAPWGTRRRSVALAPARMGRMAQRRGWGHTLLHLLSFWKWLPRALKPAVPPFDRLSSRERYEVWLRTAVLSPERARRGRRASKRFGYRPRISVVMPVYDPDPAWLRAAVESVRSQWYTKWELCIADDGSRREDVRRLLRWYASRDPRIKVRFLERNSGISAASNAALDFASGEFVGFLDHDDELKPNALAEVVRLLNRRRDLDYIYSDEDKVELDGSLTDVFFKPDWSPDLLMSVNYVTHFSVYRADVLRRVGSFRSEYDGSQDYDLVLRVSEGTDNIAHIPLPLYSWRKVPGSAAASLDFKDYAYVAGKKALEAALGRRNYDGSVEHGIVEGRYRARYTVRGAPRVRIVIPTRDRRDLLQRCIESIRNVSTYPNYDIVVVDNNSEDADTLEYLEMLDGPVIRYPRPFNYAALVNHAVEQVGDGDFLLLLNNDTEVIAPDWIQAMVEHGQRPEVAAVGARLLLPNGDPQHEGILVGVGGQAAMNAEHAYFGLGRTIRNCSAVTAACMLIRPDVFRELGGFEERLAVAYNDVDFCLRAREKGYEIVYTPYALLFHEEGASRGLGGSQSPDDEEFFRQRWAGYVDPYYNVNLDRERPFEISLPR